LPSVLNWILFHKARLREEAKRNLLEVVEIQFEEMTEMGTLDEYLEECGYKLENGNAISMTEMVGFQKEALEIRA